MATDMVSVLLERTHSLSEQTARLSAVVTTLEQRMKLTAQAEKREVAARLRELAKEVASLKKKIGTEPIALRQVMNTWWLRLIAIVLLGVANIDLKHAVALMLQLK